MSSSQLDTAHLQLLTVILAVNGVRPTESAISLVQHSWDAVVEEKSDAVCSSLSVLCGNELWLMYLCLCTADADLLSLPWFYESVWSSFVIVQTRVCSFCICIVEPSKPSNVVCRMFALSN